MLYPLSYEGGMWREQVSGVGGDPGCRAGCGFGSPRGVRCRSDAGS